LILLLVPLIVSFADVEKRTIDGEEKIVMNVEDLKEFLEIAEENRAMKRKITVLEDALVKGRTVYEQIELDSLRLEAENDSLKTQRTILTVVAIALGLTTTGGFLLW